MKTYSKAETDSLDDRAEWVPAEVARGLYRSLFAATSELHAMRDEIGYRAMTMDVIRDADAALAAADGDSHEDAQTT